MARRTAIQIMEQGLNRLVVELSGVGISERIALNLVMDVCKGRLKRLNEENRESAK